ncbi:MAG: hypothetical protein RJB38_517 [Pseudomonadota bacterium]|jgi:deoxyribose-phosphate aldolase
MTASLRTWCRLFDLTRRDLPFFDRAAFFFARSGVAKDFVDFKRIKSSDFFTESLRQVIQKLQAPPLEQSRSLKPGGKTEKPQPLARRIDHTLLKPDATLDQILQLCDEAKTHHFASVCVHPHWLPEVVRALQGSSTLPITVIGFPLGASQTKAKAAETRWAVASGAREIDVVINIGRLKSGHWKWVFDDLQQVTRSAGKVPVKVILETSLLSHEEKIAGAILAELAGARYVKTSTGFSPGGATLEDIHLLRRVVAKKVRIKASGGIKTREFAEKLIEAGADRLGTSSGVALVTSGLVLTGSY